MAISKELALAIDFKKAPEELQKMAHLHYDNMKIVTKMKSRLLTAAAELEEAEKAAAESEKGLSLALRSWDPEVDSDSVKENK